MASYDACPNPDCPREPTGEFTSWGFPVYTCGECGKKYCQECGGDTCPDCGSSSRFELDKVYAR